MSTLKRFPIKYIRDFIKKDYKLRDKCYVCGATDNLELHHLFSVSELFRKWCQENKILSIDNVDEIKEYRVKFSEDCAKELSHDNLFTLCGKHHKQLHSIYGQTYSNHLTEKIHKWLDIQRLKNGRL
jgi:hypothetical protein